MNIKLISFLVFMFVAGCTPDKGGSSYNEKAMMTHFYSLGLPGRSNESHSFFNTEPGDYSAKIKAEYLVKLLIDCKLVKCYIGLGGPDSELNKRIFKLACDMYQALKNSHEVPQVKIAYYGGEQDREEIGKYTKSCDLRMTYVVLSG